MAEILTYPLNGPTYNAEDMEAYLATRTSGVAALEDNFSITPTGYSTVEIGPGLAWIHNERFGGKVIALRSAQAVEMGDPDPSLSRIDLIVLRFSKIANGTTLTVLKGTPSSSPVAPGISRSASIYDLCLYSVMRQPATAIGAGAITSTMADHNLCGVMRDGVTGIPTDQVQAQAEALIARLNALIDGKEAAFLNRNGGTMTGNLGLDGNLLFFGASVSAQETDQGVLTLDGGKTNVIIRGVENPEADSDAVNLAYFNAHKGGGGGGGSVDIDTTLTVSGAAADAKTVGDELRTKQDKGKSVEIENGNALYFGVTAPGAYVENETRNAEKPVLMFRGTEGDDLVTLGNIADPTEDAHAATKAYVDAAIEDAIAAVDAVADEILGVL